METRSVVVALVAILNFAVETLEKLLAADVIDGAGKNDAARDKDKDKKTTHTRPPRGKVSKPNVDDGDEGDEDDDGDENDEGDDAPTEDDVIDAVRAAQKVIEKVEIAKILKTKGKAARASEVEPARRQAVIDALSEAVEAAD